MQEKTVKIIKKVVDILYSVQYDIREIREGRNSSKCRRADVWI
jgi:hypothetical protein